MRVDCSRNLRGEIDGSFFVVGVKNEGRGIFDTCNADCICIGAVAHGLFDNGAFDIHFVNSISDYTLNLHLNGVCLKDIMITIQ